MNIYTKGAIWRVWDLQIQTILDDRYESLSKYYENLKTADTDKWDTYVNKVGGEANALLYDSKEYFADGAISKQERCTNYVRNTFAFLEVFKPQLGVIGITDHNYNDDLLIDEFFKYSKLSTCQVLCGVEINVVGIHMLVYFNKPPYGKMSFSDGIKTFLSNIDIYSPTTNGVLTVCSKSCHDVIKEIKDSDGIFIYPHCNSNNGLFQERGKTDRTHLSDIFNHLPAIILQGNSKENITKVANYIQSNPVLFKSKAIYTTASDARCLNEFGNPDKEGNYLWIKADPTFEGFRQINFEPTSRVRIEKERPEDKQDYLVIDKVRFIADNADLTFPKQHIEINDKLNGIIGGKSSGKSILLYYIAKTIDSKQVNQKIADSKLDLSYDFENDPNFDFEVIWQDGETYKLRDTAQEKSRQITYVPQMFINYLAEKGGQPELRKLIQDILEQKPEFKALYDAQDQIIKENKIKLTTAIENFFQINDQLASNETNIKAKGDKKARQDNVKQKNIEIDELRKKSGFSLEEEAKYQDLKNLQTIYTQRFTNLSALKTVYEKDYLTHLRTVKDNLLPSLNNIHNNIVAKFLSSPFLSSRLSRDIKADNKSITNLFDELIVKSELRVQKIEALLALNEGRLSYYRGMLAPFMAKIQNQEKLDELTEVIEAEQFILNEISSLEIARKTLEESKATSKDDFLKAYKSIFESYQAIADTVNSNPVFSSISAEKGIMLSSKIDFDIQKFAETGMSLINSQGYLGSKIGAYIDGDNNFIYNEQEHLSNIEDFFEKIQNHETYNIKFNRGGDIPTLSKKLLQDFFIIKYELSQNEESILKMSPGKKGMILLFLILHLSNAEYPILIDQPEDNLDNRTVYKELKEFIKEKKIARQIIIVTHNANLVVPTDAENIVIANQNGQDNSKDNEKYRFEYITGSLENSFSNPPAIGILNQMGIKEHVCDILEGGTEAFIERELKYDLK